MSANFTDNYSNYSGKLEKLKELTNGQHHGCIRPQTTENVKNSTNQRTNNNTDIYARPNQYICWGHCHSPNTPKNICMITESYHTNIFGGIWTMTVAPTYILNWPGVYIRVVVRSSFRCVFHGFRLFAGVYIRVVVRSLILWVFQVFRSNSRCYL